MRDRRKRKKLFGKNTPKTEIKKNFCVGVTNFHCRVNLLRYELDEVLLLRRPFVKASLWRKDLEKRSKNSYF